jgi:hypothetical protein
MIHGLTDNLARTGGRFIANRWILLAVAMLAVLATLTGTTAYAATTTVGNTLIVGPYPDGAQTTYVHEEPFGVAAIGQFLET